MTQADDSHDSNAVNQAEEILSDLDNSAANQAADLAQQTEDQLRHLGEQAQAAAETLADQGQEKLSDAAQQTSDKIDSTAHRVSGVLHELAGGLRRHAPEQGMAGEITQQVAEGLEESSSFLEEQSRKGVIAQTSDLLLRILFLASMAVAVVVFVAWLGNRRSE